MDLKLYSSYLTRIFGFISKKQFIRIGIYQFINIFACYLYILTLEDGTLDYLLSRIFIFLIILLLSLALTIAIFFFNIYALSGWMRIISIFLQILSINYTLRYDLDTNLKNHGLYNALVYIFLFIIFSIIFLTWKIWIYLKRKLNNNWL